MNDMIHIAAVTQLRLDTDGRAYYRRKRAAGKKPMEAMRCLKRPHLRRHLPPTASPTPNDSVSPEGSTTSSPERAGLAGAGKSGGRGSGGPGRVDTPTPPRSAWRRSRSLPSS